MSIEEQRRQLFEQHATDRGLATTRAPEAYMFRNGRRVPVGGYILHETAEAWAAWNAALDSVVIDLPNDRSLSASDDPWYVRDICQHAVDLALGGAATRAVKLPEEWDVGDTGLQMVMSSDEVRSAIEAAGLKVAP